MMSPTSRPQLSGKSPWEFACAWYDEEAMVWAVQKMLEIPADVQSREFALWLTIQYRIAMSKGITMGLEYRASQTSNEE